MVKSEVNQMAAILILAGLAVVMLAARALNYYGIALGLLYYLGARHGDLLEADKVKELRDAALARRIGELFGKRK